MGVRARAVARADVVDAPIGIPDRSFPVPDECSRNADMRAESR